MIIVQTKISLQTGAVSVKMDHSAQILELTKRGTDYWLSILTTKGPPQVYKRVKFLLLDEDAETDELIVRFLGKFDRNYAFIVE